MQARIYKPAKVPTQSGRAGTDKWVLEYEPETPRRPEPVMGWIAAGDTLNQVRMHFDSRDAAMAFAESRGLDVAVAEEHPRKVKPRSYLDNFRYFPYEEKEK